LLGAANLNGSANLAGQTVGGTGPTAIGPTGSLAYTGSPLALAGLLALLLLLAGGGLFALSRVRTRKA
jgi:hypothetical protein